MSRWPRRGAHHDHWCRAPVADPERECRPGGSTWCGRALRRTRCDSDDLDLFRGAPSSGAGFIDSGDSGSIVVSTPESPAWPSSLSQDTETEELSASPFPCHSYGLQAITWGIASGRGVESDYAQTG